MTTSVAPTNSSTIPTQAQKVTIVGAGLVGSLLAILLARRGYLVEVIERRPDPRTGRVVGGRSINLALSDRGLKALERAGIAQDIEKVAIPMPGRTIHAKDGTTAFQPYGLHGQAIRSVSRGGLNTALLELCHKEKNVRVAFDRRCVGADLERPSIFVETAAGDRVEVETDILIAADGAFSAVRTEMQKVDRFEYSQSYLEHGYKELVIPAADLRGTFQLDKNALHIWPRSSFMLIALPNLDGSFTCTLFFPMESASPDAPSFASLRDPAKARAFFAEHFADALALMPTFDRDWADNPVSSLVTVKCAPWTRNGKVLMMGDAAHAIVPFFGQGMNAGFEDARVLMDVLDETRGADGKDDWGAAMPRFFQLRKPNADAIATLALENFVEMRDKVGQPAFLFRKKVEAHIARLCPDQLVPAYTMVTFTPEMPYAEALARARKQDAILDAACALPGIGEALVSGTLDDDLKRIVAAHL
jgi:kynurenine 3-monooxygenase